MKPIIKILAFFSILATALTASLPARAAWFGWENLGGIILEEPECLSWSANRIDCFARGTDRAMYHRWWDGNSWGGWENLGGIILEEPECVSWGPNRIDCFARGTDRAMYHRWWDGNSWGGWENLGGIILEAPECVSWGPNRIDCFARGTDRAMYHRWWNGNSWGGWENLGGIILEKPECVSWGPNRIDCFARGTDRAMYHRWWNGNSWGGWENLGGIILERPECVSWGSNRIDCFARGTDRAMYHRWWNGNSWGGWENLGGIILEQPECTSWSSNRIDCFARGTDRAMYHRWWDGNSWGGWENLGGIILEQPSCTTWSANRIDCFARGTDRAMYHRWFTPGFFRSITVSRHNTVSITAAEVDSLLADGSTVLRTNDGNGDVACDVNITRSGGIGVFNNGDGSLDTQAELSEIFGLGGNVKVVRDVNWCANRFNSSFIGCGLTPGASFITERFTGNQEGILWTHEFGHNQGLPHRDESNNNVMFFSIGTNRRNVNQGECNSFAGTGPAVAETASRTLPIQEAAMTEAASEAMPAGDMSENAMNAQAPMNSGGDTQAVMPDGSGMDNVIEGATPSEGQMPEGSMPAGGESASAKSELPPVAEFVMQIYFEGLPLDVAAQYGEADVDTLLAMLADEKQAAFHENIALTLGMIGSAKAVDPLIAYLKSGPSLAAQASSGEDVAHGIYRGRVGAVMGLGYIVNKTADAKALTYLIESTRPAAWTSRSLTNTAEAAPENATLPMDMSKYAIFSLGLSGNAEAIAHLKTLVGTKSLSGADNNLPGIVAQSLELSTEVTKKGLVEYYRTEQ